MGSTATLFLRPIDRCTRLAAEGAVAGRAVAERKLVAGAGTERRSARRLWFVINGDQLSIDSLLGEACKG